jgi:hypothetical protein
MMKDVYEEVNKVGVPVEYSSGYLLNTSQIPFWGNVFADTDGS